MKRRQRDGRTGSARSSASVDASPKSVASRNKVTWLLAAGAVAALLGLCGVLVTSSSRRSPEHWLVGWLPWRSVAAVERLSFPSHFKTYRAAAEVRYPMVLSGTVVDQWRAKSLWTSSYLADVIQHGSVYSQVGKSRFITFHDNRTLEPVIPQKWQDFNVKSKKTVWDVLNATGDQFYYFSEDIENVRKQYPSVVDDIQPLSDLILAKKNVQINLWIGRAGIVTHTHYDATYNFFVQLQGRKRFTLFPPASPVYLYPCLHSHYGHSQVDVKAVNHTLFPLFQSSHAVVAELGPGDLLVLPPFWLHHVETLEQSVSVNVWSVAEELEVTDEIYKQSVPFESDWNMLTMMAACRFYFRMISSALGMDFTAVWTSIYTLRYEPLVRKREILINTTATAIVRALCHDPAWEEMHETWSQEFQRGVRLLTPLFQKIHDESIRKLCVENYMEHLLATVLPVDHILPFFSECRP